MATPPLIDVAALLLPIPSAQPMDPKLERESVASVFRQFLASANASRIGQEKGAGRAADLDRLIELGCAYLARKSKDLVVAAWLAEVLTEKSGLAGLRDGLNLMRGLISQFWAECYPRLGRDDDPELRARSLESMASERSVLMVLRRVSLADPLAGAGNFGFLDVRKGPPGRGPALTELDLSTGPVGESISRSSRQFYERLAEDLSEAANAAKELGQEVGRRFHADPPDLSSIGKRLSEFRQLFDLILAIKGKPEPDSKLLEFSDAVPGPVNAVSASSSPSLTGPDRAALNFGRVLIEFLDRANSLAADAARLKKNREEYDEATNRIKELDAEYRAITERIANDADYKALLSRKLGAIGETGTAQ